MCSLMVQSWLDLSLSTCLGNLLAVVSTLAFRLFVVESSNVIGCYPTCFGFYWNLFLLWCVLWYHTKIDETKGFVFYLGLWPLLLWFNESCLLPPLEWRCVLKTCKFTIIFLFAANQLVFCIGMLMIFNQRKWPLGSFTSAFEYSRVVFSHIQQEWKSWWYCFMALPCMKLAVAFLNGTILKSPSTHCVWRYCQRDGMPGRNRFVIPVV